MDEWVALIADIAMILLFLASAGGATFRYLKNNPHSVVLQWETWTILLVYFAAVLVVWIFTDAKWVAIAVSGAIGVILNLSLNLYIRLLNKGKSSD